MNHEQLKNLSFILMGVAIGLSLSQDIIPNEWKSISGFGFLMVGTWWYVCPPKFLQRKKIKG